MSTPTIFFLGATGYLGSQLLVYLARDLPQYHIVALVRPPTVEKEAGLKAIYPNLSIVEGYSQRRRSHPRAGCKG